MRKFRILDVESVQDFALGFQNEIFELVAVIDNDYLEAHENINKNCLGYYILNTYDGELIFAPDEVEEIKSN